LRSNSSCLGGFGDGVVEAGSTTLVTGGDSLLGDGITQIAELLVFFLAGEAEAGEFSDEGCSSWHGEGYGVRVDGDV